MAEIWKLLPGAPVLKELKLELYKEAFDAFDESTAFPESVRVVILKLRDTHDHSYKNFIRMLETRAPNVDEVRFRDHDQLFDVRHHCGPLPFISTKILRFVTHERRLAFVPASVVDLTINGARHWTLEPIPWPLEELDAVVDLKLQRIYTNDLLKLSGKLPVLKSVVVVNPQFTLPKDQWELAATAVCRPGVKVIFRYETGFFGYDIDSENENEEAEKGFWRSRPDVVTESVEDTFWTDLYS
jgi:hypothetical protein